MSHLLFIVLLRTLFLQHCLIMAKFQHQLNHGAHVQRLDIFIQLQYHHKHHRFSNLLQFLASLIQWYLFLFCYRWILLCMLDHSLEHSLVRAMFHLQHLVLVVYLKHFLQTQNTLFNVAKRSKKVGFVVPFISLAYHHSRLTLADSCARSCTRLHYLTGFKKSF